MNSGAERFNGLMAMLGIVAGLGAYATTGQMIPGIFWIYQSKKLANSYELSTNFWFLQFNLEFCV